VCIISRRRIAAAPGALLGFSTAGASSGGARDGRVLAQLLLAACLASCAVQLVLRPYVRGSPRQQACRFTAEWFKVRHSSSVRLRADVVERCER
jgi:hypothetical protein